MGRRRDALEGPALELCRSLRGGGHGDLAAFLSEAIPTSTAISHDEHRPLLRERLGVVADKPQVARGLREEAARLAAVAAELPSGIPRTGTVWIAWGGDPDIDDGLGETDEPGYEASWQPDEEGDHDVYEDGPRFATLDDALDWAHRRTDSVLVRPAWDEGRYYWSGTGAAPAGYPPLEEPRT